MVYCVPCMESGKSVSSEFRRKMRKCGGSEGPRGGGTRRAFHIFVRPKTNVVANPLNPVFEKAFGFGKFFI